jgi:transglutaminase-like putative cysteine protease
MRLAVSHRTVYRYDRPARFVAQSHRLTPADSEGQRVERWAITAEGAQLGARCRDGAGDLIVTMTHQGPVEEIAIVVDGLVETRDTAGVLRGHAETISPLVYQRPTAATVVNRALSDLGDRALAGRHDAGVLDRAHLLAAAVADSIAYAPGATHAHTTAAEALEIGQGVCQDHAHAMIALARVAGLPARYVTGYLFAGDQEGNYEASHAWAEVFVAGLGWVGFDAANRCCPDERYIRLGSGRDARDAAPIRGVSGGLSAEVMEVDVVVADADADADAQLQQSQSQQPPSQSQRQR